VVRAWVATCVRTVDVAIDYSRIATDNLTCLGIGVNTDEVIVDASTCFAGAVLAGIITVCVRDQPVLASAYNATCSDVCDVIV